MPIECRHLYELKPKILSYKDIPILFVCQYLIPYYWVRALILIITSFSLSFCLVRV